MKTRFVLLLAALLPLMTACSAQPGDVEASAAPTTSEAAVADAAGTPQGPEPVLGTDYELIEGGAPYAPTPGKVEVVEIFSYTCSHCFRFQALLTPWKASLPADVSFIYLPAVFGGVGDQFARAAFAAQGMGVFEQTHEAVYTAIQVENKLASASNEDISAMYAGLGVDGAAFAQAMTSFGNTAQLARAHQFALRSRIGGTPSLVVNGRYLVKGNSFEDMLRITGHLIARERAAQAG